MSKSGRTFVSLIAVSAFLCLAAPRHAGDNSTAEENAAAGKFDQGKQGDALGGLERTAGKTINDVNVPSASAPQPVSTSTGTAGGYDVGASSKTSSGN